MLCATCWKTSHFYELYLFPSIGCFPVHFIAKIVIIKKSHKLLSENRNRTFFSQLFDLSIGWKSAPYLLCSSRVVELWLRFFDTMPFRVQCTLHMRATLRKASAFVAVLAVISDNCLALQSFDRYQIHCLFNDLIITVINSIRIQ